MSINYDGIFRLFIFLLFGITLLFIKEKVDWQKWNCTINPSGLPQIAKISLTLLLYNCLLETEIFYPLDIVLIIYKITSIIILTFSMAVVIQLKYPAYEFYVKKDYLTFYPIGTNKISGPDFLYSNRNDPNYEYVTKERSLLMQLDTFELSRIAAALDLDEDQCEKLRLYTLKFEKIRPWPDANDS